MAPSLTVTGSSTSTLTLAWKTKPGPRVSFFMLEMKTQRSDKTKFQEVIRDPKFAGAQFQGWTCLTGLRANNSYTFRVRSFNAHGASPFVQHSFTTQPRAPSPLQLVKAFPHEISVRWRTSGSLHSVIKTKFVLEKCVNEDSNYWQYLWSGCSTAATLDGLDAGRSYKLRVYAINSDGIRGPNSTAKVVTTLEEQPAPPIQVERGCNYVKISWKEFRRNQSSRSIGHFTREKRSKEILRDWLKTENEMEETEFSMSLRSAFRELDVNGSGLSIHSSQLNELFLTLGVRVADSKVKDALNAICATGEEISLHDFQNNWWSKDDARLSYIVEMTEGEKENVYQSPTISSAVHEICYQGPGKSAVIKGLQPSTTYSFRLQYVTPQSCSCLSDTLRIVTLPSTPLAPLVVHIEDTNALIKLNSKDTGKKIQLEKTLVDEETPESTNDNGWKAVYEGSEELIKIIYLLPNRAYKIRIRFLNGIGEVGSPSDAVLLRTSKRRFVLDFETINELFKIDCCEENVMVGDLILFTEFFHQEEYCDPKQKGAPLFDYTNRSRTKKHEKKTKIGFLITTTRKNVNTERVVVGRVLSQRKKRRMDVIRLEVLWCYVPCIRNDKSLGLKVGSTIERKKQHLFAFESLRAPWESEEKRLLDMIYMA